MHFPANARSEPIPLDASFVRMNRREVTQKALERIVCSVKFELLEQDNAFRLLGPETSYHAVDPYLPATLRAFKPSMVVADIPSYRSRRKHFDLCFEDSWTGYFIASCYQWRSRPKDLVLIHLDDHRDMMPTLLCRSSRGLVNPTIKSIFDPKSTTDWEAAICSGAVNIGNFVTPFYYSGTNLHVRHITNSAECGDLHYVSRLACAYELIAGKQFAAISMTESLGKETVGTYRSGANPSKVLDGVPETWTLIHIDLDYFINDFNGASRGVDYIPDPTLRTRALEKMEGFFNALRRLNPIVDRWMIATSPGFCSAHHWEWLLTKLGESIEEFESTRSLKP